VTATPAAKTWPPAAFHMQWHPSAQHAVAVVNSLTGEYRTIEAIMFYWPDLGRLCRASAGVTLLCKLSKGLLHAPKPNQ